MAGKADNPIGASEEQKRYGAVLDITMKIGLLLIVAAFVLYLVGFPKPQIPVGDVAQNWGLKVDKYLEVTGIEKGWSWLGNLDKSDFLNFAPIVFLASITVICYLAIIPILLKKKDLIFVAIAALEVVVLVLAASGVLPSGGH